MKNFRKTDKINILVFFVLAGVFFMSCGLEDTITIEPPVKTVSTPLYSDTDYTKRYCGFETVEAKNNNIENAKFTGTEIYYKIYNNYSNLTSQRSAITSVNTASNGTAAATKLIETYTFQTLRTYPEIENIAVFVPTENNDRVIIFRPKSYKGSEEYLGDAFENFRACVKFSDCLRAFVTDPSSSSFSNTFTNVYYDNTNSVWKASSSSENKDKDYDYSNFATLSSNATVTLCVPYRYNSKSFDFFDDLDTNEDANTEPEQGDDDFYYSSSASADNTYYVQFFAVGLAFDSTTLGTTYSLVLDLGSIAIIEGE